MANPGSYFSGIEGELVNLVWAKAGAAMAIGTSALRSPLVHTTFAVTAMHAEQRQLVYASDLITSVRGDGESGSGPAVNQEFGKPEGYFSDEQIGNVEHFYRAAFLSAFFSPLVSAPLSAGWELVVDPLVKHPVLAAIDAHARGESIIAAIRRGLADGLGSYSHNWRQVSGPNEKGIRYGTSLLPGLNPGEVLNDQKRLLDQLASALRAERQIRTNPPPPPAVAPAPPAAPAAPGRPDDYLPDWEVKAAGEMLSKVSLARYGTYHLWPLIWDENRAAIGSNPNKVPVGLRLKIRKKERYSTAQIDDAKKRSPNWAQYK